MYCITCSIHFNWKSFNQVLLPKNYSFTHGTNVNMIYLHSENEFQRIIGYRICSIIELTKNLANYPKQWKHIISALYAPVIN